MKTLLFACVAVLVIGALVLLGLPRLKDSGIADNAIRDLKETVAAAKQGQHEGPAGEATKPDTPDAAVSGKVIYKCVDARGRVSYTEQACAGRQEKVIDVKITDEPSIWEKLKNP